VCKLIELVGLHQIADDGDDVPDSLQAMPLAEAKFFGELKAFARRLGRFTIDVDEELL
jgi:hypothetical protein